MLYFLYEGNLSDLFGIENFKWEQYGFDTSEIIKANQTKHQIFSDGRIITIYPISNSGVFYKTLGSKSDTFKVISEKEAEEIHSKMLIKFAEDQITAMTTPTEEEAYKAEQLLFLARITNALEKGDI